VVRFERCIAPASNEQIDDLEHRLGLQFPADLRRLFREANGGRPEPYVYRDDNHDTDVSECLALRPGRGSALWTYELLVLSKQLVPRHFFPFAVDSGGDCFFVDCSVARSGVYVYVHDTAFERLRLLCGSIDEFWTRLVRG
jgi:hypothetical protein